MILTPLEIEHWTQSLLLASGLPLGDAATAAQIYRRASLRGLGHHDLTALPQRLGWLSKAEVNPRPRLELISSSPSTEVWDGDEGLGEVLCHHILVRSLELARKTGLAYAGIRRSNHFLAADPYVQIGTESGFLIVVWSNTDAGMAFPGGQHKAIGNNPLGWGLGLGDQQLSADLCMAESSLGHLKVMAQAGESVPSHWGTGPTGTVALDAQDLLAGAIQPIGGAKGLSLALLGEVLTGVLSGGATLDAVIPPEGLRTHNQMVLAFDLAVFGGAALIGSRVADLRDRAKTAGKTSRLPGDRSRQATAQGIREGVTIPPALEATLREWSQRLGVKPPPR